MDPATAQPQRSNTLPASRPTRPKFNSMLTSDRLRESCLYRPASRDPEPARPRRSVFRETGLDDDVSDASSAATATPTSSPGVEAPAWPGTGQEKREGGEASPEARANSPTALYL